MKGKRKRGADDLDFDNFDEGSGEWSGLGAGLDKTSALCTVANDEAGRGNFDDKYHGLMLNVEPLPALPWMDDPPATFIRDLCRRSLDEIQVRFIKYVQVILTLIWIPIGMLLVAYHIFCRTSSQLLTTEARLFSNLPNYLIALSSRPMRQN